MKLFKFGRKDTVVQSDAATHAKEHQVSNNEKKNNNNNSSEERSSHRSSTSSSTSNNSSTRSKQPSSSPTIATGKRDSFMMGNQATESRMSELSIIMSKFIVESASKTYGSIESEEEQVEFLRDMRDAVRGSVIAPAGGFVENDKQTLADIVTRNGKRNSDVVKFLVDASNGAMDAMETENEKNAFKQHLRNNLRMRFLPQREMVNKGMDTAAPTSGSTTNTIDEEQQQHDYSSNRHHRRSVWVHRIPSSTEDRNDDIDDDDDISL
jgi:hypothetical protein